MKGRNEMGRMLGSFADDNELDRPDLNKCPDCDCFFASDTCPLCKKVCPEEMRAGNRKPVKQKKQRKSGSGRVQFISWYHRWWFIILMIWAIPIVGIVLLVSSPHEKWKKWLVGGIYIAWILFSTFGFTIASYLGGLFDKPVDTGLTQEEYVERCQDMQAEQYYRAYADYENDFIKTQLIVVTKAAYVDGQPEQNNVYYVCTPVDSQDCYVIVRDCLIDSEQVFIKGDVITVYGQGDEYCRAYDTDYKIYDGPCLNMAYATLTE